MAGVAARATEDTAITDPDRRRLALYPLYRVDIIKDSIDFGGITSPAARQKVRFIVNTLFKLQEMRYNLTNYGISNSVLERYAQLLTKNIAVKPWREKQYNIVNAELKKFKQTPILYPICHLGYFQDRDPSERIVVPALYNKKPLKEFREYHVKFGIHDSGKPPNFFDSAIRQVQTPGSFIDPAARSRAERIHMINLNVDDFRTMGLAHLLDQLQVRESRAGDVKYIVSLSLNGSPKFTFEFTDDVNIPIPPRASNDNDLLAGNRVKNAYINTDSSTYDKIINYILVKLLGDLLQVYYGRKLINDRIYNKNELCVFTSDKNVLRLAIIFQIACLIQDLEHKLQGSERTFYTYYAYKTGRDPNKDPITSHMRINKLECKKIIKHNDGIIRTFTECLAANAIYVGVKLFSPIPPQVIAYMTNARAVIADVNRTIEAIHRTEDTDVYGIMLSLQMDPLNFKEVIDRYRATDAVRFTNVGAGVHAYSALTTRLIFPLLEAGHGANARINAEKHGPVTREFRQFVYGSPMSVRDMVPTGADADADAGNMELEGAPSAGVIDSAIQWLKQVTSIDGIIHGIRSAFSGIFRGGNGKKGAGAGAGAAGGNNDDDGMQFSTILDGTPYNELNNIIVDAIDKAIDNTEPKPDIFIEDVLALIYPYFALRGQFTINPVFYGWFITYIISEEFTGYIDTRVVDSVYERIHSSPGAGAAAGGAGVAGAGAPGPEYDINGQVFFQPDDNGAGGEGAARATADVDNLYNSVPSVLEAWQGDNIVRQIRSRPDRSKIKSKVIDDRIDSIAVLNKMMTNKSLTKFSSNIYPLIRKFIKLRGMPIRLNRLIRQLTKRKGKSKNVLEDASAGAPGGDGTHARRTRKNRNKTIKRILRKFKTTGRI